MLQKLPGIDIPIATEAKILLAAAFLAFKQRGWSRRGMIRQPTLVGCMQLGLPCCCVFGVQAERLVKERHDTAAYPCWMHAVGIAMLLRFWRSSGEAGQGEA